MKFFQTYKNVHRCTTSQNDPKKEENQNPKQVRNMKKRLEKSADQPIPKVGV